MKKYKYFIGFAIHIFFFLFYLFWCIFFWCFFFFIFSTYKLGFFFLKMHFFLRNFSLTSADFHEFSSNFTHFFDIVVISFFLLNHIVSCFWKWIFLLILHREKGGEEKKMLVIFNCFLGEGKELPTIERKTSTAHRSKWGYILYHSKYMLLQNFNFNPNNVEDHFEPFWVILNHFELIWVILE